VRNLQEFPLSGERFEEQYTGFIKGVFSGGRIPNSAPSVGADVKTSPNSHLRHVRPINIRYAMKKAVQFHL
jgi:hypothetical protein